MTVLVLGIGNSLLSDEGAGLHALALLRERGERDDVAYVDGGTLGFALAPLIEDADALIVLDAARMQGAPGTWRLFAGEDMDAFLGGPRKTPHEVSLRDVLAMARLRDRLPARRALLGIEPGVVDWGTMPSGAVAAALPAAAAAAGRLLDDWAGAQFTPRLRDSEEGRMPNSNIIPIKAAAPLPEERGNAPPVLHELRHALARLLEHGEATCIDLRSLPMGPGDEAALEAALGTGEIHATLRALGESTVQETAYPGVWLVTHRNEAGETLSRFIEVAFVPAILESPADDVRAGLRRLSRRLAEEGGAAEEQCHG